MYICEDSMRERGLKLNPWVEWELTPRLLADDELDQEIRDWWEGVREVFEELLNATPEEMKARKTAPGGLDEWDELVGPIRVFFLERIRRARQGQHNYLICPEDAKEAVRRWAYTLEEARRLASEWEPRRHEERGWEGPLQIIRINYNEKSLKIVEQVTCGGKATA
jgi:hypothetical protein